MELAAGGPLGSCGNFEWVGGKLGSAGADSLGYESWHFVTSESWSLADLGSFDFANKEDSVTIGRWEK